MKLLTHFTHITLTNDQQTALEKINTFLVEDKDVFILKGYAGSGKTTLLKGIIEYLESIESNYQLMAPTGRAAKVIHQKTEIVATTIHKGIYSYDELEEIVSSDKESTSSFRYYFKLRNNTEVAQSVYIIDEASMVSNNKSEGEFFRFGSGYLLNDLIEFSGINRPTTNVKIIFVGDPAQLPPIGMNFSPALDNTYLEENFSFHVESIEMKEVKRQNQENGILNAAASIRKGLTSGFFNNFNLQPNKDIFNVEFGSFLDSYNNVDGTKVIISYKNKTANDLNKLVRNHKYGSEQNIRESDQIIIGSNNYTSGVMNGEFGVVNTVDPNSISRTVALKLKGGETKVIQLTWRKVELFMPSLNTQINTVKGYILENYLYGDTYLKPEEQQALYVDFKIRNPHLKPKTIEFKEAISADPFFNAIMLKFGYAVTCHKAQGGEWENTFVFWDKGVSSTFNFYESTQERAGKTNSDFYRWSYTAITRASDSLYCINPPKFNAYVNISYSNPQVTEALNQLTGQSNDIQEILIDEPLSNALVSCGLENEELPLQDHFIKIRYQIINCDFKITSWEKKGYELNITFNHNDNFACLKFWFNKYFHVKDTVMVHPSKTNSPAFAKEVISLISKPLNIVVNRNTAETIISQIEWDINLDEKYPFLQQFFYDLKVLLNSDQISIESIDHMLWKEKYTLKKGKEKASIYIEYGAKGFIGRFVPLSKETNSQQLLDDLKASVHNLRNS